MKKKLGTIYWYYARWVISIPGGLDALCRFITLGFCNPCWEIRAEAWFLDVSDKYYPGKD